MGRNKRKRDDSSGLAKKLRKLIKSRSRSTSPSISSDNSSDSNSHYREPQSVGDFSGEASEVEFLDESILELDEEELQTGNQHLHETPKVETIGQETEKEKCVPQEILSILGEGKKPTETFGKKVPKEISERWGKIIQDGLAKDIKEGLINKTLIPENFQLAKAPKLNAEVSAILSDSTRNRDKRLEKSQNQLGFAIARLVNLTTDLIDSEMEKIKLITQLSEINQILLDLHYEETQNRRRLIIPLLDKKFTHITKDMKRDMTLFGENLNENIKISKTIEKSGQQIKKRAQANFNKENQGNMQGPPRQYQPGPRRTQQNYARPQPSASYNKERPTPPAQATRRQRAAAPPAPQRSRMAAQPRTYDQKARR